MRSPDHRKVLVVLVVEVHILRRQEQETLHQHHRHKEILEERVSGQVVPLHMVGVAAVVPVQLELLELQPLAVQVVLDLKFLLQHHQHQHNQ